MGAGLEVTLPTEAAEGEEAPTPGILSLGAHASEAPDAYGKGDFQFYGHVKLTDNFEEGTAAKDGVAISAKGVKDAWDRLLNLQSEVVITSSGNWTAPETATYAVTCIGGGGKGGNGSTGVASSWSACQWGSESVERYGSDINHGGNGGGGGGAGQTITQNVTLTKGDIIPVTVGGGAGGSATFGEHLTALGGGTGGNGVAPTSTDPLRFTDDDLLERELSYGRSGFQLQFMLDTRLSDADRYPLKLGDLIVMGCGASDGPEKPIWASGKMTCPVSV